MSMSIDEVKALLGQHHASEPQRLALAHHALESIRAGLQQLASLGHSFEVRRNGGVPLHSPMRFEGLTFEAAHAMVQAPEPASPPAPPAPEPEPEPSEPERLKAEFLAARAAMSNGDSASAPQEGN